MQNRSQQQNRTSRSGRNENLDHSGGYRQSSEQRLPYESNFDDESSQGFSMEGARRGWPGDDERDRSPSQRFDRSEEMGSSRMSGERSRWGSMPGAGYEDDRTRYAEDAQRYGQGGYGHGSSSGGGYGRGGYDNDFRTGHHPGGYSHMGGYEQGGAQRGFGGSRQGGFGNNQGFGGDQGFGGRYEGRTGGSGGMDRAQRGLRGPKGYTRSDERIREDLCDRLSDGRFDCSDVDVRVSNGEVTLTGTVADRRTKYELEELSDAIGGVKDVHNQLTIKRDMGANRELGASRDMAASKDDASMKAEAAGKGEKKGEKIAH